MGVLKMSYNFDKIIIREGTNSVKWDSKKDVFGRADILPMWVADTDFEAPIEAIDAMRKRLFNPIFGYTFPSGEAYSAVVNRLYRGHGCKVEKEEIVFCDGVVGGINTAIKTFTKFGDKILILEPVYHPFKIEIKSEGRIPVISNLILENGRYEIDYEDLKNKIKEVKLFIFCSPHNPIGKVWEKEELIKIGNIVENSDCIIISDEIHCDLIFKGSKHIPLLKACPDLKNKIITFMAPSKSYNLAGLNQSYGIIQDKSLREMFKKGSEHRNYGNIFGIEALTAALDFGDEYLKELMEYLDQNRRYFINYVDQNIKNISVINSQGTYLLWVDFRKLNLEKEELIDLMINKVRIGANYGEMFGLSGKGFFRFNIGCPRVYLEEALKRLEIGINSIIGENK